MQNSRIRQDRAFPPRQTKLVIFTEHRDTLNYLHECITNTLGNPAAVACIDGQIWARSGSSYRQPSPMILVCVLLATDAAGEGNGAQCAHLMVNYDLPVEPQSAGATLWPDSPHWAKRKSAICGILWRTKPGRVRCFMCVFHKLNEAREALGGQVFYVLGQVIFGDRPLRDLLIEAVCDGDPPEIRARLKERVEGRAGPQFYLRSLMNDHTLSPDAMDTSSGGDSAGHGAGRGVPLAASLCGGPSKTLSSCWGARCASVSRPLCNQSRAGIDSQS